MGSRNTLVADRSQAGAALVTVVLISTLLLTASIALLTAVGAGARETTDVLSETKAYYAAESGLQSTINILRNDTSVTYSYAVANPNLAAKLAYATVNGISQVPVGSQVGYSINLSDPDNTAGFVTFYTDTYFQATTGAVLYNSGKKVCVPDCPVVNPPTNRVEITYTDAPVTNWNFTGNNPSIGSFTATTFGSGAAISTKINFSINYKLTVPRTATRTIRGWINTAASGAGTTATFQTEVYDLMGSHIEMCGLTASSPGTSNACTNISPVALPSATATTVRAYITPVEPYRLLVTSTGYGPNGAQKHLEGIIQKNFLNDLPSSSGLSMVGPGASLTFSPGNGNPTYCGVDPGVQPGQTLPNNPSCTINPNQPSGPAIGVSDQAALDRVLAAAGNTAIVPPPSIITDAPDWQQSPAALDAFLAQLRHTAQTSGRYIPTNANGTSLQNAGQAVPYINAAENISGQGVTFCEGNCSVGPISGGGILVVTGNFEYSGNFNFRGLIIVAGPPGTGVLRNGAGNGVILGNMVISPYNSSNLAAGFSSPSFSTNGGGNSDIMFSGLSLEFDGTSAISNFMLGVAEK